MTANLTQSGVMNSFPISINTPLSEGAHDIRIEATNAAGLTAVWTHTIYVDRTGPTVRSTQVTIPTDATGQPTGIVQIQIGFTNELDPATAENLANYLLTAANDQHWFDFQSASDQTSAIVSVVYTHRDPQTGLPPAVTITADFGDRPAGDYELVLRAHGITDLAGNPLMGGDLRVPFQFNPAPPVILSVRPAVVQAGQPSDVLIIQFSNVQLRPTGVEQVANYRLAQTSGQPTPIVISTIHYDSLTNQAYLTTATPLTAGTYQLTVLNRSIQQGITGITSVGGLPLDGDGDGRPGGQATINFDLSHPISRNELLQSDSASLSEFAKQIALDALAQRKSFSSPEFANQLLTRLQLDAASAVNEQALAQAISQQLVAFLNRQALAVSIDAVANPNDYLVVWARDARFLLSDPNDGPAARRRIGFNANGVEIDEISGATLVQTTVAGETFSLAMVPLTSLNRLASNELATVDGQHVQPLLSYGLDVQGLAATNAAGVLIVHGGKANPLLSPLVNLPQTAQNKSLDLSQAPGITGFDPQIDLLNQHFQADLEALFGPLDQLQGSLLFGWFDPVDYQLSEATGQTAGALDGVAFQNVAGGFSSSNAGIGVVVIPGSLGALRRWKCSVWELRFAGLLVSRQKGVSTMCRYKEAWDLATVSSR